MTHRPTRPCARARRHPLADLSDLVVLPTVVALVAAAAVLALTAPPGRAAVSTGEVTSARGGGTDPDAAPGRALGSLLIHSDAEVLANPRSWQGATVVLQPWQGEEAARLKSRNPDLTVLMYKNMSATYRTTCTDGCTRDLDTVPSGVGYHWAEEHHPEWFLRDDRGRKIEWADWREHYPMDTGDPAYQDTWASNVLAELRAAPWDGVMMDDTLTWLSHPTVGDRVARQIPTDEAQRAATGAFLAAVAPRLVDAGFEVVPNITLAWDSWRSALHEWSPLVTGWEQEHFVRWSGSTSRFRDTDDWSWKVAMARWLAERDLPLLAITYGTPEDRATMRFHRATWLLTWNGRTGASVFVTDDRSVPQNPAAASEYVGAPLADPERAADGTWSRRYAEGLVLVNPTGTRRAVRVPPGYGTRAGDPVRRLRLGPSTGRVLYAL